jgi:hypothetical protein
MRTLTNRRTSLFLPLTPCRVAPAGVVAASSGRGCDGAGSWCRRECVCVCGHGTCSDVPCCRDAVQAARVDSELERLRRDMMAPLLFPVATDSSQVLMLVWPLCRLRPSNRRMPLQRAVCRLATHRQLERCRWRPAPQQHRSTPFAASETPWTSCTARPVSSAASSQACRCVGAVVTSR